MQEYEVIIAQAGLFDIPESQLEKMWICPRHRNVLGKEWRPHRSCQYPTHQGDQKNKGFSCSATENGKRNPKNAWHHYWDWFA